MLLDRGVEVRREVRVVDLRAERVRRPPVDGLVDLGVQPLPPPVERLLDEEAIVLRALGPHPSVDVVGDVHGRTVLFRRDRAVR